MGVSWCTRLLACLVGGCVAAVLLTAHAVYANGFHTAAWRFRYEDRSQDTEWLSYSGFGYDSDLFDYPLSFRPRRGVRVSIGIPFRMLSWDTETCNTSRTAGTWTFVIDSHKAVTRKDVSTNILTFRVRPLFAAFNIALCAGVLLTLYLTCVFIRGKVRASRGLCSTCAYELRHIVGDICPECGNLARRHAGRLGLRDPDSPSSAT